MLKQPKSISNKGHKKERMGKFICDECGAEFNITERIPSEPIPKELESERLEIVTDIVDCPKCGKPTPITFPKNY